MHWTRTSSFYYRYTWLHRVTHFISIWLLFNQIVIILLSIISWYQSLEFAKKALIACGWFLVIIAPKKHLADKDSSSDWQLLIVVKWLDCPDCTDMSYWINQGMLSMPLFHPLFWLFCTMQPFVLTCTCHLHFMIIHAEMPIHFSQCLLDLRCSFYKLDKKKEEEVEKYQLPLTESLNRQYIQKVISPDYHIILCRVEAL